MLGESYIEDPTRRSHTRTSVGDRPGTGPCVNRAGLKPIGGLQTSLTPSRVINPPVGGPSVRKTGFESRHFWEKSYPEGYHGRGSTPCFTRGLSVSPDSKNIFRCVDDGHVKPFCSGRGSHCLGGYGTHGSFRNTPIWGGPGTPPVAFHPCTVRPPEPPAAPKGRYEPH